MDDRYRLKIKIGVHEFEAEGPAADVREQFAAFKDLIAMNPAVAPPLPQNLGGQDTVQVTITPPRPDTSATDGALGKIMRVDNRVVSLTVRPDTADDAVLLILYGQRTIRENESITGGEVIEGLTATGGLAISRVDRLLEKLAREGSVIVIGERRGKRYRLTNTGLARARQVATEMISLVA